jgi:hypothetical protein
MTNPATEEKFRGLRHRTMNADRLPIEEIGVSLGEAATHGLGVALAILGRSARQMFFAMRMFLPWAA